jgi:hypothetical protein
MMKISFKSGFLTPWAWFFLGLLALSGLGACAYYSTSGGLVGGIRSVAIPAAENETSDAEVAELLSVQLADAFSNDGRLRVVDEEGADALLMLRVTDLEDKPFTYTAAEVTEQYRFRVLIAAELVKQADESRLLEMNRIEGWGTYDASLGEDEGRSLAIEAALEMVIEEIVDRTTASW